MFLLPGASDLPMALSILHKFCISAKYSLRNNISHKEMSASRLPQSSHLKRLGAGEESHEVVCLEHCRPWCPGVEPLGFSAHDRRAVVFGASLAHSSWDETSRVASGSEVHRSSRAAPASGARRPPESGRRSPDGSAPCDLPRLGPQSRWPSPVD